MTKVNNVDPGILNYAFHLINLITIQSYFEIVFSEKIFTFAAS